MVKRDPLDIVSSYARCADEELDLADVFIAFATLERTGLSVDQYFNHIKVLSGDVQARYAAYLTEGAPADAGTQLASLRDVLALGHDYIGDNDTPDDLQNWDMTRVIDRRCGAALMLSAFYMHVGRAAGWMVEGLNVPGRFLARVTAGGQSLMFDPFEGARAVQAHDVRGFVKEAQGAEAELSSEYFDPVTARDMVFLVQNHIRFAYLRAEDYTNALRIVQALQLFAPQEYRLLLDAGVLYARVGQPDPAIFALEHYIEQAPDSRDRREAALLLDDLKRV